MPLLVGIRCITCHYALPLFRWDSNDTFFIYPISTCPCRHYNPTLIESNFARILANPVTFELKNGIGVHSCFIRY